MRVRVAKLRSTQGPRKEHAVSRQFWVSVSWARGPRPIGQSRILFSDFQRLIERQIRQMPANPTPARTDVDDLIEDFVCKQVANRPRAVSDRPEWHNRLVPPPGKPAYRRTGVPPFQPCQAVTDRETCAKSCCCILQEAIGSCVMYDECACSWTCCTCSGTTRSC